MGASFLISILLSGLVRRFSQSIGLVDRPNLERKVHTKAMPLFGGFAIFAAFFLVIAIVEWRTGVFTVGDVTALHLWGFFFASCVLMIGGFLDDKYTLRAYQSICFPIIAVVIAVFCGIGVSKVTNPFGGFVLIPESISAVITILWLLGMTYTTKLLDGLDGLATGIGAIASIMIALLALSTAFYQPDIALMSLIAAGALGGFLLWNFHPAKIYLGEGGSTFVGFMIGVLAVIAGSKLATALLVMGIPALDVCVVMIGRWRAKKPIFSGGDRTHLHQRFFDHGMHPRAVAFLYYVIALSFGLVSLLLSSWQKVIALGVLGVLMLCFVYYFSHKTYDHA